MACVKVCPGRAISATETVKVALAGRTVEWSKLDTPARDVAFRGAMKTEPGEIGAYLPGRNDLKPAPHSPFYHRPPKVYYSGQAVCDGADCIRACMISLEQRGVLNKAPFRRPRPWTLWIKH